MNIRELFNRAEAPTFDELDRLPLDYVIDEALNWHDLSTDLEYEALALLRATKVRVMWSTSPDTWGFFVARNREKGFYLPYPSSQFAYGVILHELGHYDIVGHMDYYHTSNTLHGDDGTEEMTATFTGMQHTAHWSRTMTISALLPMIEDARHGHVSRATFNAYRDKLIAYERKE